MSSKIWIASTNAPAGYKHLYLVYDPDGDPTSEDEFIFRGGPEDNVTLDNIKIENWVPIDDSEDFLGDDDPYTDRNYTQVNLNGKTPEEFVQEASDWSSDLEVETDTAGNSITDIPYTLPIQTSNGNSDRIPALNSNTTIKSVLTNSGVDFDSNIPNGLSFADIPGAESYYSSSDGTVQLGTDKDSIIYSTGGENTYEITANSFGNGVVHILEDSDASTSDTIIFKNVNPEDVRYERDLNGSVNIYLPWDGSGDPSVVIHDQFSARGNPKIAGMWIEPLDGSDPIFIPLDNPDDVPLFTLDDLPPWLSDALAPIFGTPGDGPLVVFYGRFSPLVLDIDGSGTIDLTNLNGSDAYFDFWGDGYAENTGWVAPQDGLLALDVNGNGSIDDVSELFGSGYPLEYVTSNNSVDINDENGFAKLSVHDSNGDGVISSLDVVWNDLRIWQDADQDGVADDGELVTLDALGIESIDIANYQQDSFGANGAGPATYNRIIEDNVITHTSSFTKTDGTQHEIVDAWFQLDQQQTYHKSDYTLDVRTLFLPTLRGYGQIADLHIAMSLDNGAGGLLEQVESFATSRDFAALFTDFDAVRTEVEEILFAWAGIDAQGLRDNPAYDQHGLFQQMPEYHFIRKIMGQDSDFIGTWFDQSPYLPRVADGIEAIFDSWENFVDAFTARLVFQAGGSELFETGASYNPFSDVFEGTLDLSQTQIQALEAEASSHGDVEGFWHSFAVFIDQVKGIDNLSSAETSWISSAVSSSTSSALSWADIIATLSDIEIDGQAGDTTITGTRWDDVITGFDGGETLIGGDGNDIVRAYEYFGYPSGDEVLEGGLGNDILFGGMGNDIYRYDYGHDVIEFSQTGNPTYIDIIEFGAGINPEDVTLQLSNMGLVQARTRHAVFEVAGRGTISMELGSNGTNANNIDELHFADGTIIQTSEMIVHFHGSNNDDWYGSVATGSWGQNIDAVIYGYDGNDLMSASNASSSFVDGGLGNDTFYGSIGDDVLFLSAGNDQFYGGGGNNTILLPEGYDLSDVSFYRWNDPNQTYPSDLYRRDALIEVNGLGSVSVIRQFDGHDDHIVQTLEFADGSTVDLLNQNYITLGSDGDDDFNGSGGIWPSDNDIYLFSEGHDIIRDTAGDHDTLLFGPGYQFSDLTLYREDLAAHFATSDHLVVEDNQGNTTRIYLHFRTGNSYDGYELEHLEFHDGTIIDTNSLTYETRGDDTDNNIQGIGGSSGIYDDVIYSYAGHDDIRAFGGNDVVFAGIGNDDVGGHDGDDELHGEDGDDALDGNDGNDTLIGGAGSDILDGGDDTDVAVYSGNYSNYTITDNGSYFTVSDNFGNDGVDTLYDIEELRFADGTYDIASQTFTPGSAGPNVVTGTSGHDNPLNGTSGDDEINGLAGQDVIFGLGGNDIIDGGDANDTIDGGQGDDILDGAGGNNTVSYESATSGVTVDLSQTGAQDTQGAGVDTLSNFRFLRATNYNDTLTGNDQANRLYGLEGNDIFTGGGANDDFYGDNGIDTALYLSGFSNYAIVNYGSYQTVEDLVGNDGTDKLYSIERIEFSDGVFANGVFSPTNGNSGSIITGTSGADNLSGTVGEDEVYGLEGNDTLYGSPGADIMDGGPGADYVNYTASSSGVAVDLQNDQYYGGDAEGDTLVDIRHIFGSENNDILRGDAQNNLINGFGGDDVLAGSGGLDTLKGGNGADRYVFDAASAFSNVDIIRSFKLSDQDELDITDILLGTYNPNIHDITDFVQITDDGQHSYLAVDANGGGNSFQTIAKIENVLGLGDVAALESAGYIDTQGTSTIGINIVNGTALADQLNGTVGKDEMYGFEGNDTLYGSVGADIMDGGAGANYANYQLSDAGVNIDLDNGILSGGYAEGDTLLNIKHVFGSYDHGDVLRGDAQDNLLNGFAGDDILYAGAGQDILKGGSGNDQFIFESTNLFDGIDTIRSFSSNQDTLDVSDVLIGYDSTTDAIADFVQITDDGQHSYLEIDTDGGANNFQAIAKIENKTGLTDVTALENSGALLTEVL